MNQISAVEFTDKSEDLYTKNRNKVNEIYTINNDQNHRIHIHIIICGGLSPDEICKIWGYGNIHVQILEPGEGIAGAAKYLYKQNEMAKRRGEIKKKARMWIPSRGLKQPEEYWCYPDKRMMKLTREEYAIKENCKMYFPSYTYQNHEFHVSAIHESIRHSITLRKTNAISSSVLIQENAQISKCEENCQQKVTEHKKAQRKKVKVNSNYYFTYDGKHYSMPAMYKEKSVQVQAYEQHLDVYYKGILVRTWIRSYENIWMIDPSDIPEGWNNHRFLSWADKIGVDARMYIEALIMRRRYPVEAYRAVQGILVNAKNYNYGVFNACCRKALARKVFSYSGFIKLLNECRDLWVDEILHKGRCKRKDRFEQLDLFGYIDSTNNQ